MVTAEVGDGSGRLSVVFFNQPWRERQLQPGLTVALFGRADTYRGSLQMTNPVVDLIGDRTGRIVPIYPQSEKADLNTWEMAGWVESALERCRARGIADPVPEPALRRFGLVDRQRALFGIHAPESMAEKEEARRRLAFDELLRVQLVLVLRKKALERDAKGIRHDVSGALVGALPRAAPVRADRRPAGGDRRDRARPGRPAPDAPAPPGRRRIGQDGGRRQHAAGRRAGRPPGRVHGADRGPGRAARGDRGRPPRRRDGAGAGEPLPGPAPAGRTAHEPGHRPGAAGHPGRAGRRHGRRGHRHARAHPGGRPLRQPRRGRDRRAAPVRRRAARPRCGRRARRARPAPCPTSWS